MSYSDALLRHINHSKHGNIMLTSFKRKEAQLMLTNARDAFRDQSRSSNIVPFHMLGIVSQSSCAIVTLSLRCAVFPIFDFKNAVNLKTGLGSVKVIGNITIR